MEVVKSLEKKSQQDGNLGWSRRGIQVPYVSCKDLILAYPFPAVNGATAPSRRPSSLHLDAHFPALKWAKRMTLVHINHKASQEKKYLCHEHHFPVKHLVNTVEEAELAETTPNHRCDQPLRADDKENLHDRPKKNLHDLNHCQYRP